MLSYDIANLSQRFLLRASHAACWQRKPLAKSGNDSKAMVITTQQDTQQKLSSHDDGRTMGPMVAVKRKPTPREGVGHEGRGSLGRKAPNGCYLSIVARSVFPITARPVHSAVSIGSSVIVQFCFLLERRCRLVVRYFSLFNAGV